MSIGLEVRGITHIDYFLWGYLKSLAYADTSNNLLLVAYIVPVIHGIRPAMLAKVVQN